MDFLENVIRSIFWEDDDRVRVYAHQRRVRREARPRAIEVLISIIPEIQARQFFRELFDLLQRQVQDEISGIGPVFTYDAALRISSHLGFRPETVWLIADVREGARAIGLRTRQQFVQVQDIPFSREFESLHPHEIHHLPTPFGLVGSIIIQRVRFMGYRVGFLAYTTLFHGWG